MHELFIHLDPRRATCDQLYDLLRERILGGELKPGQRLPPTRELARQLAVTRKAVVAAYNQLAAEGYVHAHVGSGTWVRQDLPDIHLTARPAPRIARRGSPAQPSLSALARHALAADPLRLERQLAEAEGECISFSLESGLGDEVSLDTWNRLVLRRLRRAPHGYGPAEGCLELRQVLAQHLLQSRGIRADPGQILILSGAQQGIDLIGRALLQPGSAVLMEDPGFRGARLAFEALGARLLACPIDREGIVVDRAPRWRVAEARLAFVTPSHQFPTGEVMSLDRRRELLAWAHAADAIVAEDDYQGELRFTGRPLPAIHALDGEARVVYVGTFSRILYPDLRLGYMVLPWTLVEPIVALKRLSDWFTSVTLQAALADFICGGHYQRHLRRLHRQLAERRSTLLASLHEHFAGSIEVTGAASGQHLAVWFHDPGPEAEAALLANATTLRVGVHPLSPFCLTPPTRLGLLLGYGRLSAAEIREGVRRLAMAWRATRHAPAQAAAFA